MQATLHAGLGAAVGAPSAATGGSNGAVQGPWAPRRWVGRVDRVPTCHPALVINASRGLVAYGPGLLVLLGYSLVLWDVPLGLLGFGYLLLLVGVLGLQPRRGRWCVVDRARQRAQQVPLLTRGERSPERGGSSSGGGSSASWNDLAPEMQAALLSVPYDPPQPRRGGGGRQPGGVVVLSGSPPLRWVPLLLLALLAAADFAAQAALPAAAALREAIGLPQGVLDFLEQVVGECWPESQPDRCGRVVNNRGPEGGRGQDRGHAAGRHTCMWQMGV